MGKNARSNSRHNGRTTTAGSRAVVASRGGAVGCIKHADPCMAAASTSS